MSQNHFIEDWPNKLNEVVPGRLHGSNHLFFIRIKSAAKAAAGRPAVKTRRGEYPYLRTVAAAARRRRWFNEIPAIECYDDISAVLSANVTD